MVSTEAYLHKLSLSDPCNLRIFKPSLVQGLPPSKPVLYVRFCSRRSHQLVKMQFHGSQTNIRVFEQKSLVKDSCKISSRKSLKTFQNDASVDDLSAFPSELFMSQQFEANLNRQSKWIATGIFMVFLVWKYDEESLWLAMGSVINYIICATLKRILKQDRPVFSSKSDPGMPSSHAQSIFYILTAILLSIIEKIGENIFTVTISALALASASYLSWLRVSQRFHTRSQVIVGGAVGSIFSTIWFRSWDSFVKDAFIWVWWVRATVFLGAATFFLGYLLYIIHHAYSIHKS